MIPSPSSNSFNCTRISTGNENSLIWNSSMLFLRLTYPQTVSFVLQEGLGKGAFEPFWHNIDLLQSVCLVQSETVAFVIINICYWQAVCDELQNTLNKKIFWTNFFFFCYNSKWMNKFLHRIYLDKVRNKRIATDV